jgi:hypothetical protein
MHGEHPFSQRGNPMAKKRGRGSSGESVSGYFRKILEGRPDLINGSTNKDLLERWLRDHPQVSEVPKNVKYNLANLKSLLRKKMRLGRLANARAASGMTSTGVPRHKLESLEEQIDDCISAAKNLDREGLAEVIHWLKRARNQIVWKLGE